ncbi:putative biopolymer transport protein exbB-like 2 [Nitrospina gracilis 3/211]|uniref:Putative biopolymer transport protein exbB-like 2 n=1 Tax=Nitrospina gracilis (strain 3/211) TaxID=1266370 RepID=M1Z8M9_NITG3|nr:MULTISPECIES: MotA/TolQ/ExbB proton channel family protein [Nitrospina]MCF8722205.1 biopolymer transport protein ExbB [Nitrospina sp. Nb-3]CCQ89401.1 putative biopolymer transport protein exbB-like 2 [Nitrospina gracilis 3/211]
MTMFQSAMDLITKGGIIMVPILLCSVIAVAIIIERLVYFNKRKENPEALYKSVQEALRKKNTAKALELCRRSHGPVARVLEAGVHNHNAPKWQLEETLSMVGQEEMESMERNIKGLEVIAAISPLMGLLGTVIGMVQAFNQVAEYKGQVNPSLLAGGIWEALLTTAAGLAVAIPVLVMMHFFDKRIERLGFAMERFAHYFVHSVEQNRNAAASSKTLVAS